MTSALTSAPCRSQTPSSWRLMDFRTELSCGTNCPAALGTTVQTALNHVKGAIFQAFATNDGTVSTGVDFLGRVQLPALGPNARAALHVRNARPPLGGYGCSPAVAVAAATKIENSRRVEHPVGRSCRNRSGVRFELD